MSKNIHQALKLVKDVLASRAQIPGPRLRLPPLPSPRDIVKLYKLQARKQLAQNFLLDLRITQRIVKSAGNIEGGDVCEVGPGPGSITRSILSRNPGRLLVIEKDPRFLPSLYMLKDSSEGRMHITLGDVLLLDMDKLFREELRLPWDDVCPNIHIIGNLPFNIATPLIIRWLRNISLKQSAWNYGRVRMTLTFQKEVADRIVAPANHPQRCRLSVMCQNWCDVRHNFTIKGSAFVPPPDVDVGVVNFRPKVKPIIDEDFFLVEKVIRQMFSSRQKNCLKPAQSLFPSQLKVQLAEEMLRLADIRYDLKPYQLTNDEFNRIVSAYKHICNRHPSLYKFDPSGKSDKMFWTSADGKEGLQKDENFDGDALTSHHTTT